LRIFYLFFKASSVKKNNIFALYKKTFYSLNILITTKKATRAAINIYKSISAKANIDDMI